MNVEARRLLDLPDDEMLSKEAIAKFYEGMKPFWHPVVVAGRLGDQPLGVKLLGRRLVLARLDGGIACLPDTCRHFQARLSLGERVRIGDKDALQCPYHGWAYGSSGACVRIPQLVAGRKIPPTANLPSFGAVERHGLIWVCLAETATYPIPEFPEYGDPSYRKVLLEEPPAHTSSIRMVMGTLDDTHFPWVHEGILGDRSRPEPPNHRARREGHELIVQYEMEQPRSNSTTDMSKQPAGGSNMSKVFYNIHVGMPSVIRLAKTMEAGAYVIWLAASPTDYNVSTNFWVSARNYDLDPDRDAVHLAASAHVREQDKRIIESQRPWLIPPFWTQIEMPMGPGDLPLMEFQKWLEELGISTAV